MKLRIRYENEIQTIELNEKDTETLWVSLSLEGEGISRKDREELIQETWEEQYNRPDYNQYHREARHIDPTPKRKKMNGTRGYICGDEDDICIKKVSSSSRLTSGFYIRSNIDHQLRRSNNMEYHIESTKTNAGTRKIPMTEDVYRMFQAILEDRPTDLPEVMINGYVGFLFRDKNGMPEVALHWEHRFKHAVNRYNSIFKVQMPKITPYICRHTYCSNQAKAGMNPKTLQYLMGHSDIGVTMNTYTHLGLDDAKNEMIRMEELEQARKEVDKAEGKKPMKQNMFKVV